MKRIDTLFDADSRQLAAEDRRIRAVISRSVPANWQSALLFARLDREVLHLTVRSAGAITNLRFLEPVIRRALTADGTGCRSIKWHVAVQDSAPATRPPTRRKTDAVSAATASHLQAVADSLDDPDLADALRRLAGTRAGRRGPAENDGNQRPTTVGGDSPIEPDA